MIVVNNKIIACTESELFDYWLTRYDDIWSYPEYKRRMVEAGVEIVNDKSEINSGILIGNYRSGRSL